METLIAPIFELRMSREGQVEHTTRTPDDVAELVRSLVGDRPQMNVVAVLLNVHHDVIGATLVARGSLSEASLVPADVFRPALVANAHAVVIGQNRPSGHTNPSPEDVAITIRMIQAGELLGIEVLDHVLITPYAALSMRERGIGFTLGRRAAA